MNGATTVALAPPRLAEAALDQLFLQARTHNRWLPQPVDESVLRELYELARMAPTAANTQPLRVVFLTTPEAKERLRPALAPTNVDKTMSAPVTAIVAYDLQFFERLPELMPHVNARAWFATKPAAQLERDAALASSMQGGYLILAARALGLDCGPIGGFNRAMVDAEFFPDGQWQSNFILNLGHGDPAGVFPRNPRLAFDDACRILQARGRRCRARAGSVEREVDTSNARSKARARAGGPAARQALAWPSHSSWRCTLSRVADWRARSSNRPASSPCVGKMARPIPAS